MNTPRPKKVRKFDREFKLAALNHWHTSGKMRKEAAADLGINECNLKSWKRRLKIPPSSSSLTRPRTLAELEADNLRLRRENQSLRNQREILKKSLGILSEPPTSVRVYEIIE